jgi:hypothetical protein
MQPVLRQLFAAILGGVVAASVILAAPSMERAPKLALAQSTVSMPNVTNADAPRHINYQGQVFNPNGGAPYANATLNFSFRLYNNPAGTNQVYREDKNITTNADGFFNTKIGDTAPFTDDPFNIFNGQELYLRIFIQGEELSPLQPITYVPYAFWADHAHSLDDYDADDFPKLVAFGVVNDDGSEASGENFDSDREEVANEIVYVIDLVNADHSIFEYTTIVTPACNRPVIVGVGTTGNDLVVDMWDDDGNRTQCRFEFMVLTDD